MQLPTIVTFVNEQYIPIGRNWLVALNALGLNARLCLVALDTPTYKAFPSEITLLKPINQKSQAVLWKHRMKVIRELLTEYGSIVHSDADAVWLQDPLPMLTSCGTDMVFSQGVTYPPDVHAIHGIVLCCGFFYMVNTDAVSYFMDKVEQRMIIDMDDQIAINHVYNDAGISWQIDCPYSISFRSKWLLRKKEFIVSRQIMRSSQERGMPLISILPHYLFPRFCDQLSKDAMVVHPLSPKKRKDKIKCLSKLGLWYL